MVSPSGARRLLRQACVRQPEPHPTTVAQWLRTLTSRCPISVGMAAFLLAAAAFPYRSAHSQTSLPSHIPGPERVGYPVRGSQTQPHARPSLAREKWPEFESRLHLFPATCPQIRPLPSLSLISHLLK